MLHTCRGSLLAQSAVLAVALVGAPLHPPFVPSRVTTPGLLVTLPYRPLHAGEVFKVTLTGITPNNQVRACALVRSLVCVGKHLLAG